MNVPAIHTMARYGAVLCLLLVTACGQHNSTHSAQNANSFESLDIKYQGTPGFVWPIELAEDLGYLAPLKLNYTGISIGGPQGIQATLTGDTDISSPAFVGSVVKMSASGAPGTAVIASYGTFKDPFTGYYVLSNSPIKSARDLIGKRIGTNIMGAQVEFMIREYLRRGGLTPEQAKQVTLLVLPPGTAEQALRQGNVDVAPLYGPAVDRGNVRRLFQDYDLVGDLTTGAYVMSNRYIQSHPNTTHKLVTGIAQAIEWSRSHPREEVVARFEEIIKRRHRNENDAMIKYWTSYGIPSAGGKFDNHAFQVWADWLVKDGQVKPEQIDLKKVYTNQYNDYH